MDLRHCCVACMQKICRADCPAPEFRLAPIVKRPNCGCGAAFPDFLVDFDFLSQRHLAALPFKVDRPSA